MKTVSDIRRATLSTIVGKYGLAATARKFGKPDRQIKDMLERRKSFGEKVARSMEQAYDPERAPGWLDVEAAPTSEGDIPACYAEPMTRQLVANEESPRIRRIIDAVRSFRSDDGVLSAIESVIDLGSRLQRLSNEKQATNIEVSGEYSDKSHGNHVVPGVTVDADDGDVINNKESNNKAAHG